MSHENKLPQEDGQGQTAASEAKDVPHDQHDQHDQVVQSNVEHAAEPEAASLFDVSEAHETNEAQAKKGSGKSVLLLGCLVLAVPIVLALMNKKAPESEKEKTAVNAAASAPSAAQMPGVVSDGISVNGSRSAVATPAMPEGLKPGESASNPEVAKLMSNAEDSRAKSAKGDTFVAKIGTLEDRKDQLPPAESLTSAQFPPAGSGQATQMVVSPDALKSATAQLNRKMDEPKVKSAWYGVTKTEDMPAAQAVSAVASTVGGSSSKGTLAEMGEVCLAAIETAISSYEPGTPVFIRVLSCKNPAMRNATGVGKFRSVNDKLVVDLTRFRLKDGSELKANALLVDKSTRRPGIASNVDGHYLERFGLITAAAFLKTYTAAYADPAQTVYPSGSGAVVVIDGKKTRGQAAMTAAGESANAIVADLQKSQTRVNAAEVTLDRGDTVGLMFLETLGG